MDAATIQARIYYGRGKVAQYIGETCNQYRPLAAMGPLTHQIGPINAAFNAGDSTYLKPNKYGNPIWYADLDGRLAHPGDYLVRISDGAVWFIAAMQHLLPIIAIDCPRQVKVSRMAASTTVGAGPYNGLINPTDIIGTTGALWPASILQGGRALSAAGIPSDVKEGGWKILLPPSVPITIQATDIITDDLGRRFAVESSELTDLGFRLTANEAHS